MQHESVLAPLLLHSDRLHIHPDRTFEYPTREHSSHRRPVSYVLLPYKYGHIKQEWHFHSLPHSHGSLHNLQFLQLIPHAPSESFHTAPTISDSLSYPLRQIFFQSLFHPLHCRPASESLILFL